MASLTDNPALRKKFIEIFNADPSELERRAYKMLVEEELHDVEASMYKIVSRHGIKDLAGFDSLFTGGVIDEAGGWEDFFELDALEYKRRQLEDLMAALGD